LRTLHDYLNSNDTIWGDSRYIAAIIVSGANKRLTSDNVDSNKVALGHFPKSETRNRAGCAIYLVDRHTGTPCIYTGASSVRTPADVVPFALLKIMSLLEPQKHLTIISRDTEVYIKHAPNWAIKPPKEKDDWKTAYIELMQPEKRKFSTMVTWPLNGLSDIETIIQDRATNTSLEAWDMKEWKPDNHQLQIWEKQNLSPGDVLEVMKTRPRL
jgi:hypothetical protein